MVADPEEAKDALEESGKMAGEMRRRLSRTAVVFTTGAELANRRLRDTNEPAICDRLA